MAMGALVSELVSGVVSGTVWEAIGSGGVVECIVNKIASERRPRQGQR